MIRFSAFFFLLIPLAANAHHSVAAFYELDASSEVAGTITEVNWVNPHLTDHCSLHYQTYTTACFN